MHDREFSKPNPLTLQTGATYPFEAYVGEFIWCYSKWNEDGWAEAQIRLGDAIDSAKPGEPVKMSLDDWEKFREANKEAQIKGPFAHKLRKFQLAIKAATKPESNEATAN